MDDDGSHKVSLYLIGNRKEKPPYHLGNGESMTSQMRQYEQCGAQDEGDDNSPSSKETVEYSPEKNLFCHGCYNSTDQEKYEDVTVPSR